MKLICIDFDDTLSTPQMLAKIKAVIAANKGRSDIKIGILSARSISDDFDPKNPHHIALTDIEQYLKANNVSVDFIATTHSLHTDPFTANEAQYPIYQESSDYLAYRKKYAQEIAQIKQHQAQTEKLIALFKATKKEAGGNLPQGMIDRYQQRIDVNRTATNKLRKELQAKMQSVIDREADLYQRDIKPFVEKAGSAKIGQVYRLLQHYGDAEVLLIDDSEADIRVFNRQAGALPLPSMPQWTGLHYYMKNLPASFDSLIDGFIKSKSDFRPTPPPVHQNVYAMLLKREVTTTQLRTWANTTHPIADKKIATLIARFLAFKKTAGTWAERKLYKKMDPTEFVTRLLTKTPLAFDDENAQALLRDGKPFDYVSEDFGEIGSRKRSEALRLADYLSHDEMQIAALLGVSSPTRFINDGARNNAGRPSGVFDHATGTYDDHEAYGIYVGHAGARFARPSRFAGPSMMECQFMLVARSLNTPENGYGLPYQYGFKANPKFAMWEEFYGEYFKTYFEAADDADSGTIPSRFVAVNAGYLDTKVYKERLRVVIEPYLAEMNKRGEARGKSLRACHWHRFRCK